VFRASVQPIVFFGVVFAGFTEKMGGVASILGLHLQKVRSSLEKSLPEGKVRRQHAWTGVGSLGSRQGRGGGKSAERAYLAKRDLKKGVKPGSPALGGGAERGRRGRNEIILVVSGVPISPVNRQGPERKGVGSSSCRRAWRQVGEAER